MRWAFSLQPGFGRIGFLDAWGEGGRWIDADSLVHWDYEHVDIIADGAIQLEYSDGGARPHITLT